MFRKAPVFVLIVLITSAFVCYWSCRPSEVPYVVISGKAMGTTYNIKLQSKEIEKLPMLIDSVLNEFNSSMSGYIEQSTLSKYNNSDTVFCYDKKIDPHFQIIFEKSQEISKKTNGAFNPSIYPLVEYYGFGYGEKKQIKSTDTLKVKSLLKLMVFDSLTLTPTSENQNCISKPDPNVKLDFNAIAKGYGVDLVAKFLDSKGILNYMVEIGGEIRARGVNDQRKDWVIGINRPEEGVAASTIELPLKISNKGMATSGNYRNSYDSAGQKFAHIINPFTGLSQPTDILSVTVIADDSMTADAYATAFMVLGLQKSLELLETLKGIDACFIFDLEGDGVFEFRSNEGFSKYFLDNEQKE